MSYNYDSFARDAYRAMVDIDASELKKTTLRLHMPIHADARMFIQEMLSQLGGAVLPPKDMWLQWCEERRKTLPSIIDENPSDPCFVNSYVFTDELFKQLESDAIVVTGNGTAYTGTLQVMRLKKGMRVFTNQGCASMGYDLPAAIGACFAMEKRPIILITGDGSIQMNIQELQTIAHHQLPIKIFILNNQGYLAIRTTQDTYFEGRHFGSSPESGVGVPDFCRIAQAYGLNVTRIASHSVLNDKLSEVLSTSGPCVCEVYMDPKQSLYPKLASIVKPDGRMISNPLEDMYPFMPRDKFEQCMLIPPLNQD